MKTLFTVLPLLALLVGCSTTGPNVIGPALVRTGVGTGVSYGVLKYPNTAPELRIAGEVMCSAASGTNISPANVIAEIKIAKPDISPEGTVLINGAMTLYIGIWSAYGQGAVNNIPVLKQYLQATCDGINDGLGDRRRVPEITAQGKWPLLRSE